MEFWAVFKPANPRLEAMEFKQVVRVCVEFSIEYRLNIATCHLISQVKLDTHPSSESREITVDSDGNGAWRVKAKGDCYNESFPQINSEEMLMETLAMAWNHTFLGAVSSLLDAKLADIHVVLEQHTDLLQRILSGKIKVVDEGGCESCFESSKEGGDP